MYIIIFSGLLTYPLELLFAVDCAQILPLTLLMFRKCKLMQLLEENVNRFQGFHDFLQKYLQLSGT